MRYICTKIFVAVILVILAYPTPVNAHGACCAACAAKAANKDTGASCESKRQEKKSINIVDIWKNIYLRLDFAKRYANKVSGFSKHPKTAGVLGAGVGYKFSNYLIRIELNAQKSNFCVTGASSTVLTAKTQAYTANLYKDFSLSRVGNDSTTLNRIMPYITAGIGSATHRNIVGIKLNKSGGAESYSYGSKKRTAWNAGIGLKFHLDKVFAIDAGCKYVDLGGIPGAAKPIKVSGYQATISVLVNF